MLYSPRTNVGQVTKEFTDDSHETNNHDNFITVSSSSHFFMLQFNLTNSKYDVLVSNHMIFPSFKMFLTNRCEL